MNKMILTVSALSLFSMPLFAQNSGSYNGNASTSDSATSQRPDPTAPTGSLRSVAGANSGPVNTRNGANGAGTSGRYPGPEGKAPVGSSGSAGGPAGSTAVGGSSGAGAEEGTASAGVGTGNGAGGR